MALLRRFYAFSDQFTEHAMSRIRHRLFKDADLPLIAKAILIAILLVCLTPGIAITNEDDTHLVVFDSGVGSADQPLVLEGVRDGTFICEIEPEFTAMPNQAFVGWAPTWEPTDVVDHDVAYTALWTEFDPETVLAPDPDLFSTLISIDTTIPVLDPFTPDTPDSGIPPLQDPSAPKQPSEGIVATGDIITGWDVNFSVGSQGIGTYLSLTGVPNGTSVASIAPMFYPRPGFAFDYWRDESTLQPVTVINKDTNIVAIWKSSTMPHNWTNALAYISSSQGWQIPSDSILLTFSNVSQNGHCFLDYVYLQVDAEGNVALYFLAYSDNKTFSHPSSYISYAGERGVKVGLDERDSKNMFCVYRVIIPAELVESTIISGMPLLSISNEGSMPHSINNMPLGFLNINYRTDHYIYEGLDSITGSPIDLRIRSSVPGVGTTNQMVSAKPLTIFGYIRNSELGLDVPSGVIVDQQGMLVLKLYYSRDEHYAWTIRGITGPASTTIYNGEEQELSDIMGNSQFFTITFPTHDPLAHYLFQPNPASDLGTGLVWVNPRGTDVGTYYQNLSLVPGYKVWYTNDDPGWDPNNYETAPVEINNDGVKWVDISDDLGAAIIVHGSLTITQRPITITTPSATKVWDGTALTRGFLDVTEFANSYTKRSLPLPDEGLLANTTPKLLIPHEIEYSPTGSQTDAGTSPNYHSDPYIFYSLYEEEEPGVITHYKIDVTRNYLITSSFGDLKVTPVIFFDANTGDGTMPNQPVTYNQSITLTANTFTKYLHIFAGWNTEPDGTGTSYTDEQTFTYPTESNMTLYAMWDQPPLTTLTISKKVIGDYGDTTKPFAFTVHFAQPDGEPLEAGTEFVYTRSGAGIPEPFAEPMVLDGNGDATFSLKHNQEIVIGGVPEIIQISIIETEDNDYVTKVTDSLTPSYQENEITLRSMSTDRSFAFTNTRKPVVENGISINNMENILLLPCLIVALSLGTRLYTRRSDKARAMSS
ncbi:MAG: InlB B-repeat-containing protein [Actinomycetia bacterium]|nr:InlB B-repeat-containing protein [Actinomycetes bacterium]